jgi:hypothetical protein
MVEHFLPKQRVNKMNLAACDLTSTQHLIGPAVRAGPIAKGSLFGIR